MCVRACVVVVVVVAVALRGWGGGAWGGGDLDKKIFFVEFVTTKTVKNKSYF